MNKGSLWIITVPALVLLVCNLTLLGQDKKALLREGHQIFYERGKSFQNRLEFDSAITYYGLYHEWVSQRRDADGLKEVKKRILECESGKRLVSVPRKFLVTGLGPAINSPFEDYAPVLNEDESLLVFTSRRPIENLGRENSTDGKYYEDIFLSHRENGEWSPAANMGPPVNTPFHDSNLALSSDGKRLYIYSDTNGGDILVSNYLNGKWSQPRPMPWPINTPHHESSISTDGKRFFVASERPGGLGGSDIWLIERNASGQWKSTNPGSAVNTAWDEDGPFIDYDKETLYFSSRGHDAMGGFDIFRSQWKSDRWLAAENLGYPINTPRNDSYFVSTRDGKRAYYSSVRDEGMGEEDIYMITLPVELTRSNVEGLTVQPMVQESNKSLLIYYEFRSSELSVSARQQLREFLGNLKGGGLIQIEGHADNIGGETFNDELSLARASSVYAFLKENGIPPERLAMKGWGTRKPAASNANEKDGRALNRRVEISVIDN